MSDCWLTHSVRSEPSGKLKPVLCSVCGWPGGETQVLVIDRDKEQAKDVLVRFKKMCEDINLSAHNTWEDRPEGDMEMLNYDINFDVVLRKFKYGLDVESIRSSVECLKWEYKKSKGEVAE